MTSVRTAARAAAVLGATAALTVAGAGAASAATTSTSAKDGDSVSVTFSWTPSATALIGDACGAALLEPQAAMELADSLSSGDLRDIFEGLQGDRGVYLLTTEVLSLPVATLNVATPSMTLSVDDVPSGAYALVTACASDSSIRTPSPVIVGDPVEVILGSLGGFSSDTGGGDDSETGIGIDTLSSALGGGDTDGGLDLGTLSSQADAGTEN